MFILRFEDLETAAFLVLAGMIFDFMDGASARLLKVSGELGKQLDSLADMITFGLVPGLFACHLIENSELPQMLGNWISYSGLLITLFSALRLAKFNIDERQSDGFIGLNTPANTLFWVPLVIIQDEYQFIPSPYISLALIVLFSYLLVSEIHLFSLKFKNLKFADNKLRFFFLGLSIIILILVPILSGILFLPLPIIVLLYLILSLANKSHEVQS